MNIDRRAALGMAGAGLGALALAERARGSAPTASDPGANQLKDYIMVRGALDDRLVIGWAAARYYGILDEEAQPLFNVRSAVFARFRPAASGGYEVVSAEIAWFTDIATGAALTTWRNPYNGREVNVPAGGVPASRSFIRPNLGMELAKPFPGLTLSHEVLPFEQRGDIMYITERTRAATMMPGAPRATRFSESVTYHAPIAALRRPGAMQVTSEVSYTNVRSWQPWLEMGDHPGHLMSTGYGRQGATIDSIPAEWQAATSERRPEVLKDPAALLATLWNTAP